MAELLFHYYFETAFSNRWLLCIHVYELRSLLKWNATYCVKHLIYEIAFSSHYKMWSMLWCFIFNSILTSAILSRRFYFIDFNSTTYFFRDQWLCNFDSGELFKWHETAYCDDNCIEWIWNEYVCSSVLKLINCAHGITITNHLSCYNGPNIKLQFDSQNS